MSLQNNCVVQNADIRSKLENLRSVLMDLPQTDFGEIICHGGGMFARTIILKKGTILAGKIHVLEHINIMSSGDITVVTEEGKKHLTGFNIMVCKPGTRRAGVCHEDTIWTTLLKTDETELAKVQELFFAKNHQELELLNGIL